jgi:hypothetical protein
LNCVQFPTFCEHEKLNTIRCFARFFFHERLALLYSRPPVRSHLSVLPVNTTIGVHRG